MLIIIISCLLLYVIPSDHHHHHDVPPFNIPLTDSTLNIIMLANNFHHHIHIPFSEFLKSAALSSLDEEDDDHLFLFMIASIQHPLPLLLFLFIFPSLIFSPLIKESSLSSFNIFRKGKIFILYPPFPHPSFNRSHPHLLYHHQEWTWFCPS